MSDPNSLAVPSLFATSGDLTSVSSGRIVHRDLCNVSLGQNISRSSFVYDDETSTSTEICRQEVTLDSSATSASLSFSVFFCLVSNISIDVDHCTYFYSRNIIFSCFTTL